MKPSQKKIRAAKLSIATAVSLALVKFCIGIITGSMAVLSSAIDSMLDIVMSGVNFFAIRQAEQPADENHAYGHGKFETIATLIQSLIIGGSGVWILFESIRRLLQGAAPTKFGSGIVILVISVLVSFVISRYLQKVAIETDSSALKADSLHFAMDVYTNMALVAGMSVMYVLKLYWIDGVLSICVALYILYEAVKLIRLSLKDVLDEQLPEETRKKIEDIIASHGGKTVTYHNLRTRKAGSQKLIDFHMMVCKHLSVAEAHDFTDELEAEIAQAVGDVDVTIHIEPCYVEHCEDDTQCELEMV